MPKVRPRATPTAEEIEAFGNQAEQPRPAATVPVTAPAPRSRKVKEPKSAGYTFRMTPTEKKLLTLAAEMEDLSEQKILERLVWPVLRERYGAGEGGK